VSDLRRALSRASIAVVLASAIVVAVTAALVSAKREMAGHGSIPDSIPTSVIDMAGDPVAAEAEVFRTKSSVLAIDPSLESRRGAHPRTLATYRGLRAYPGAPPRIPHGLTSTEVLKGGCTTCHERGGYSHRFDAYVPVTPHPEMGICLQCHVGNVKLMAIPLPGNDPSARCRQCHAAGAMRWKDSSPMWQPLPWPKLSRSGENHRPPAIPHTSELRGNCVACHAPPAAVEEISTSHSERANCRQCHVEHGSGASEFVRLQLREIAREGGGQ
jgi:nitrate reductase (cytochrome), electron transfer subunit